MHQTDIVDRFHIALFSALEQTLCSHVILQEWLVFYSAFEYPPKWCTYSTDRLVPCETAAILARSVYTIQPCTMSLHANPHIICRMHACLVVICHLHFWQNDQDLLHATVVTRGGGMDTETRVSTESWPSRRKFSHCSYWDTNPRPFDYKSGALTTALSLLTIDLFTSPPPPPPHLPYSLMKVNCSIPTL